MKNNGFSWYRAYHGMVDNTKLNIIAKKSGVHRSFALMLWVYLLEFASSNKPRGSLAGLPEMDELAYELDMEEDVLASMLQGLRDKGLIGKNNITNWDYLQVKREDENSTKRVQNHREKSRATYGTAKGISDETHMERNVTQCNADETHLSNKEREKEKEVRVERRETRFQREEGKGTGKTRREIAPSASSGRREAAPVARQEKPPVAAQASPAARQRENPPAVEQAAPVARQEKPPVAAQASPTARHRENHSQSHSDTDTQSHSQTKSQNPAMPPSQVETAPPDGGAARQDAEGATAAASTLTPLVMRQIWDEELGTTNPVPQVPMSRLAQLRLKRACTEFKNLEAWREHCRLIRGQSFLTGAGPHGWRATLTWAALPESIAAVRAKDYFSRKLDEPAAMAQTRQGKALDPLSALVDSLSAIEGTMMANLLNDINQECEIESALYQDLIALLTLLGGDNRGNRTLLLIMLEAAREHGAVIFSCWFSGLRYLDRADGDIILTLPTNHLRDWVEKNYLPKITMACRKHDPSIERVVLETKRAHAPPPVDSLPDFATAPQPLTHEEDAA